MVDIGAKAPAFLPVSETCLYKVKDLSLVGLFPGAQGEFTIVDEDDRFGRMILSLRKVQYEFAWERCRQLLTDDITVFGKVKRNPSSSPSSSCDSHRDLQQQ